MQNEAPSGFSIPHFGQLIKPMRVCSEMQPKCEFGAYNFYVTGQVGQRNRKYQGVVTRSLIGAILGFAAYGCKVEKPPSTPVGGHRDSQALPIRMHNRTPVELVIKPLVRERLHSIEMFDVVKIPAFDATGTYPGVPDVELQLFRDLPLKPENIGVFSIEVSTSETEARLGVVDIPSQEMSDAREFGRLTLIFRDASINLQIGNKRRVIPWLRPVPVPKARRPH